jgi:hypothetical protein
MTNIASLAMFPVMANITIYSAVTSSLQVLHNVNILRIVRDEEKHQSTIYYVEQNATRPEDIKDIIAPEDRLTIELIKEPEVPLYTCNSIYDKIKGQ